MLQTYICSRGPTIGCALALIALLTVGFSEPDHSEPDLWSLRPITLPTPSPVKLQSWPQQTLDHFVLARLEASGLVPSSPANPSSLLRRICFDLTGMPPTDEQLSRIEAARGLETVTSVVDELLSSSRFGERWARHWLDVARYADTKGYVFTQEPRYPYSYTYRDYVISAYNNDLPFDQFILEQLAADLIPDKDRSDRALAALGFLTLGRRFSNNMHDIIDDRIDVVTRGLLGLTVSCARCHDHKYDPIPTQDYYALYGVFASCEEPALPPLIGSPDETPGYEEFKDELDKRNQAIEDYVTDLHREITASFRKRLGDYLFVACYDDAERVLAERKGESISFDTKGIEKGPTRAWKTFLRLVSKPDHPVFGPWHRLKQLEAEGFQDKAETLLAGLSRDRFNPLILDRLQSDVPHSFSGVIYAYSLVLKEIYSEWQDAGYPARLADQGREQIRAELFREGMPGTPKREQIAVLMDRSQRDKKTKLSRRVDEWRVNGPGAPARAMSLQERSSPVNPVVFERGNPARRGARVSRRFLKVLGGSDENAYTEGSGRLRLANEIVGPNNPLTARVYVNRVWMHLIGRPLVNTPSDFGKRSTPPTHSLLLDHLAAQFILNGWSSKKLIRSIVLSACYQQASLDRPEAYDVDPENALLWKMNRKRLEFEPLRDSILGVAGSLDATMGGRPVELFKEPFSQRRSIYGIVDRQNLPSALRVFDFASPDSSCPKRPETTVPQQALFLMNNEFVLRQARLLVADPGFLKLPDRDRHCYLYRRLFSRQPSQDEIRFGQDYVESIPEGSTEIWQQGYGALSPDGSRVTSFTPLPHWDQNTWRGGPELPDPKTGWVFLNSTGGHPGDSPQFSAIRRWTAPLDCTVRIMGRLSHPSKQGNGVRGSVVCSSRGRMGQWNVKNSSEITRISSIDLRQGETIDFVVEDSGNTSFDTFGWAPVIQDTNRTTRWSVQDGFHGPREHPGPWEKYVHVLFMANEFAFVD